RRAHRVGRLVLAAGRAPRAEAAPLDDARRRRARDSALRRAGGLGGRIEGPRRAWRRHPGGRPEPGAKRARAGLRLGGLPPASASADSPPARPVTVTPANPDPPYPPALPDMTATSSAAMPRPARPSKVGEPARSQGKAPSSRGAPSDAFSDRL